MNVEILVERFRRHFGHTNLREESLTENEYDYKKERGDEMRQWLAQDTLHELMEQKNWKEIGQRVVRAFAMEGPLARWDEYQWVRNLNAREQSGFAAALERFLYDETPFPDRLEQFVADATEVYLASRKRDPARQERYKAAKLSWPFVSYFHFLMWPDREYVFVKPTPLLNVARAVGFDLQYDARPNRVTYARVQELYRALWPTVQKMGGRDWIDVQTFIHTAGGGFGDSPTTTPPSDPWLERIAQWRAQQIPPERIETRLAAEQEACGLLQGSLGHLTEETIDQLWVAMNTDFRDGKRHVDRFSPMFLGNTKSSIVKYLERFDYWARRLWQEDEATIGQVLDDFWQHKEIPEAGTSLPTLLLYLRDPARYNIWLPVTAQGVERITGSLVGKSRSSSVYFAYNDAVNDIRQRYRLQPQETDCILWLAGKEEPPPPPPRPATLAAIQAFIVSSGYTFPPDIVANYHLSLLTKPFVILTGLSGSGKTKLTRLYADAVYGIRDGQPNPYYQIVAVRPDWTDNRGLLGYYNPLTCTYESTPFLRFMLQAAADTQHDYYVCLDEMNLARVEYYFSDFLSAQESGAAVTLHTFDKCIATRPGTGIDPTISQDELAAQGYRIDDVTYIPAELHVPHNLFISGTVNVDETTHAFSDKVLDRANSIEFERIDLEAYWQHYLAAKPDCRELVEAVAPFLHQLHDLLQPQHLHFGYRTVEEVLAYLWHNNQLPAEMRLSHQAALDNQVMQKILPKLRGDERITGVLEHLHEMLKKELGDNSRSAAKVGWMREELEQFGSTHFWR
jgi:energy-coupling factor transporter ATP-binding protein EcfA2